MKDPFFTVVHLLDAGETPEFVKLPATSTIVLLQCNDTGQHYSVTSHLTVTASLEVMRRYTRDDSKMIMVSALCMS